MKDRLAINLSRGILVDPQDFDVLEDSLFSKLKSGYHFKKVDKKTILLHRIIHSRMINKPLSEYTSDDHVRHIDPNKSDCRRSNLFIKTGVTANHCDLNRSTQSNSTTGVNGVCWIPEKNPWKAHLVYHHKYIHLGLYPTKEQATLVANHCRIVRSEITCSDTPMDFETMKQLLQAEARNILLQG